jgi:signal transduction histidine kinase
MGQTEYIISIIIFNLFFILFIVAIIVFIRQYRLKKKEHTTMLYNQQIEHQKELLSTQIEIQTQTMQHIGREIHDNIGQKLTLASLYAQQFVFENKANVNQNIENISEIINTSLAELRQLSKSLTDNSIETESIVTLLQKECNKVNALKKCVFDYNKPANQIHLSHQIKSVLVRISQEFIQNSIKHANCEEISLSLHVTNTNLQLQLEDNGIGFDTKKKSANGIGLNNMKKRTEVIGGNYDLQSSKNGTKLTIEIPL